MVIQQLKSLEGARLSYFGMVYNDESMFAYLKINFNQGQEEEAQPVIGNIIAEKGIGCPYWCPGRTIFPDTSMVCDCFVDNKLSIHFREDLNAFFSLGKNLPELNIIYSNNRIVLYSIVGH